MGQLWAVKTDENSHLGGALDTDIGDETVTINGFPVVVVGCKSLDIDGSLHGVLASIAQTGSGTVTCYGFPIHRHLDLRLCGATTVVTHQTTVTSG